MRSGKAKIEDLDKMINILEQISNLHSENRPDVLKVKSKEQIEKRLIETMNAQEREVIIATDDKMEIYGLLIYTIKEVKENVNLKDSKILWIEELGVDEKYRKKGIGKILMNEAEKIAKELDCRRMELNCWDFNENAIDFYEAIGMNTQRRIMEKRIEE